jgi:hypothetical protein
MDCCRQRSVKCRQGFKYDWYKDNSKFNVSICILFILILPVREETSFSYNKYKLIWGCFQLSAVTMAFQWRGGATVAEWLRSLTSNHLPLTAVGSNPGRDFGFFHVMKLSSWNVAIWPILCRCVVKPKNKQTNNGAELFVFTILCCPWTRF